VQIDCGLVAKVSARVLAARDEPLQRRNEQRIQWIGGSDINLYLRVKIPLRSLQTIEFTREMA
jgi:hypothetical protein